MGLTHKDMGWRDPWGGGLLWWRELWVMGGGKRG